MAYCSACEIEVTSGKFCTTCGRQLVEKTSPEVEAVASPVARTGSNLAMWSHLAPLLGAVVSIFLFVTALLLWLPGLLIRQSASATDFDRRHATESLNFQLSLLTYIVGGIFIGILTIGIGFLVIAPALVGLGIAAVIFNILGITAANNGREYRYPLSIRFVK